MTPLNLHIVNYDLTNFHAFWPVFCEYWRAVNSENLDALVTLENGIVTSKVELKLAEILGDNQHIKMLINTLPFEIVGFLHYRIFANEMPFINALYLKPDFRGRGLGGVLLDTLRGFDKVMFHIHKNSPPEELLAKMGGIKRFSESPHGDLEIWEGILRQKE